MIRRIISVLGLALGLAACTAEQDAAITTVIEAAPAAVQTACQVATVAAQDAQTVTKGGANDTAKSISSYVAAGCPLANGAVTVAANVAADPTSAAWLAGLTTELQSLTAAAAQ